MCLFYDKRKTGKISKALSYKRSAREANFLNPSLEGWSVREERRKFPTPWVS